MSCLLHGPDMPSPPPSKKKLHIDLGNDDEGDGDNDGNNDSNDGDNKTLKGP